MIAKLNQTQRTRIAFTLAILLTGYFIFCFPTLDFDEALYRSVATQMKQAKNPWLLSWDGQDLFHKPPPFYWLIWFFSDLIDGVNQGVSALACRMPSFCATIGILVCLKRANRRFLPDDHEMGKSAILAFFCGIFPMLTATAVLFDPGQTLFLMPSLVVPTLLFFDERKLLGSDWILWSLSLFAASAFKGLNGLIIPTFAFALHAALSVRTLGFAKVFEWTKKFTGFVFVPAITLTALYFWTLDVKIGHAFTQEFIWVQHFERGTSAKEAHSGTFFYQLFVIFFGGGILIPLFFERLGRIRAIFERFGFPLTYVASIVFIFGLSATKLPHYSWPAWPAICLFVGLIPPSLGTTKRAEEVRWVACLPILLIGILSFSLAFFPKTLFGLFTQSPSFLGVMAHFTGFLKSESLAFLLSGGFCLLFLWKRTRFLKHVEVCAIVSLGIALCLTLGFSRTISELMVKPFFEIAELTKANGAKPSDCIRYSGALSPTLSLALAPELRHNRCEPQGMQYLIAPSWKAKECQERKFSIIGQRSYLILCKKG